MEKSVISDNKKNAFQIKLIYLLLFVFVIMVGALVYFVSTDKNLLKPSDKEVVDESPIIPEKHFEMDLSYFEKLLDDDINVDFLENGFNDIDDLSNQEKLYLLFFANNDYFNGITEIDTLSVDNYFKINYGTEVEHENIICDMELDLNEYCYIYDPERKVYIENFDDDLQKEQFLSRYITQKVYSKTVDFFQENNTYKLTRYVLYRPSCYDDCDLVNKYFSTIKDLNNDINPLITLPETSEVRDIIDYNKNKMYMLELDLNFDIYKNLMAQHVYVFERKDNNYILKSYKINTLD